jgi:hypothetical protein
MTTSHVFVPVPSKEVDFYQLLLLSGDKSLRFPRAVGCVIVVYYIVDYYYYTFFSITHSEWLQMGQDNGVRKPVPAMALLPSKDADKECKNLTVDFVIIIHNSLVRSYGLFQQYFSYIVAVGFIGGGNQSIRRKPLTCRKSLTNFIT